MGEDGEVSPATNEGGEEHTDNRSLTTPRRRSVETESTIQEVKEEKVKDLEKSSKTQPSSKSSKNSQHPETENESRPSLPPRPSNVNLLQEGSYSPGNSLQRAKNTSRPHLQSSPTIALSRTDIHTQSYQDGSRETFAASAQTTPPSKAVAAFGSIRRIKGLSDSEGGDSASLRSYAPTLETGGDVESLLGEVLGESQESPTWRLHRAQFDALDLNDSIIYGDDELDSEFYREFDEISDVAVDSENEGKFRTVSPPAVWSTKLKSQSSC